MAGKSCSARMVIVSFLWTVAAVVVLTVGALQFHQVTSLRLGHSGMPQRGWLLSSKPSHVQMRDGTEAPLTVRGASSVSPAMAYYTETVDELGDMNWLGVIAGITVAFMVCFGSAFIHMPRNSFNFNLMSQVAHHVVAAGTSNNFNHLPVTQMQHVSATLKKTVEANVSSVGHISDRIKTFVQGDTKMQLFQFRRTSQTQRMSLNMPKVRMPIVNIHDKSTKLVVGSAAGVAIGMAISSSAPSTSAKSSSGFVGSPVQPKPPGLQELVIGMEYDSKDVHGKWWRCTIKSSNPNGSFLGELVDGLKDIVVWDEVWPGNCRIACASEA